MAEGWSAPTQSFGLTVTACIVGEYITPEILVVWKYPSAEGSKWGQSFGILIVAHANPGSEW